MIIIITNFNACCSNKCCNSMVANYLEIQNKATVPISFILQYTLQGETITKRSVVFGPGISHQMPFESASEFICFNVLNNSTKPTTVICNRCLPPATTFIYAVEMGSGRLTCKKVFS